MIPTLQLDPPPPLEFRFPSGLSLIVPPVTRGQLEAVKALEITLEQQIQDPARAAQCRAQMLAILVGEKALVIEDGEESERETGPILTGLTFNDELRMFTALLNHAHGQDAAQAVALHELAVLKLYLAAQSGGGKG